MTTNLDLLKTIYNATISLPLKQRINPEDKKSVTISKYYGNQDPYCKLNEKVTCFDYRLIMRISHIQTTDKPSSIIVRNYNNKSIVHFPNYIITDHFKKSENEITAKHCRRWGLNELLPHICTTVN